MDTNEILNRLQKTIDECREMSKPTPYRDEIARLNAMIENLEKGVEGWRAIANRKTQEERDRAADMVMKAYWGRDYPEGIKQLADRIRNG